MRVKNHWTQVTRYRYSNLVLSFPGYFRDNVGSYDHLFTTLGVMCIICSVLWLIEPLLKKIKPLDWNLWSRVFTWNSWNTIRILEYLQEFFWNKSTSILQEYYTHKYSSGVLHTHAFFWKFIMEKFLEDGTIHRPLLWYPYKNIHCCAFVNEHFLVRSMGISFLHFV